MLSRRNRTSGLQSFNSNVSDLSSDDVYLNAEDVQVDNTVDDDDVYSTIEQSDKIPPLQTDSKPKKLNFASKQWIGKRKMRLGQSGKKVRPLSAFVDNFRPHNLPNVS